jgi:hypothetical protein
MFSLVFPVKKGEALKLNNSVVNIFTIEGRLRDRTELVTYVVGGGNIKEYQGVVPYTWGRICTVLQNTQNKLPV